MNFYMDVQFLDEKEGSISIFEVVFSNYTDDKKIEKIIAGGLNTFQKRNPYIKVEDGFIEFFEDSSIKLRIESTCKYPLSKRRIEDLKQELIVAFKMTNEEKALLESKRQAENKEKPMLAALQEIKDEWNNRLVQEVGELRKSFSEQVSAIQPAIEQKISQQLMTAEKQQVLHYQELQEAVVLGNELMTEHLQEILQKEKNSSGQLKKRIAALDSSAEQRNEVLESQLKEVYQQTAAGNLEKIEFLKEKLSSEIDESNFDLKEEISFLGTDLAQRLEEDGERNVQRFSQLDEALKATNNLSSERAVQLNQQVDDLMKELHQTAQNIEPITTLLEKKETADENKLKNLEESILVISEKLDKELTIQYEEHNEGVLKQISELKTDLNQKIEEELSKLNEMMQSEQKTAVEAYKSYEMIDFEEQLTKMKRMLDDNVNQITPLFSTLQKENIMLTRKIDNLEALIADMQNVSEEQTEKEQPVENILPPVIEEELFVEEEKKPETEKKTEAAKVEKETDDKEEKAKEEQPKPLEPERRIEKVDAKLEKLPDEKKPSNEKKPTVQRIIPKASEVDVKPKQPRERPDVNPFQTDFQALKERFSELESAPRFDKQVRLSKFDYRKSITHVHYIEYRWENAVLDKEDYHFFGLDNFEEKVNELPEFLDALKADNKKESLFNQNSFKLKKTVWEKIKAYHLLSIYLDQILTWRQG